MTLATRTRQGGYSLIEVLIAVAITATVMASVFLLLQRGQKSFLREPEVSDMNGNARSGLGVEIVDTPLGTAYGHGGFFPGYLSLVLWYPDAGISVALQVNSSAGDALAKPMRDVLLEAAESLQGLSAK